MAHTLGNERCVTPAALRNGAKAGSRQLYSIWQSAFHEGDVLRTGLPFKPEGLFLVTDRDVQGFHSYVARVEIPD